MTKYSEEQRASVRRSIVEYGIPGFICVNAADPIFIAKCEEERRQLVAEGKAKDLRGRPVQSDPVKAKVAAPKPKTALAKAVQTYITGGPEPAPADDADQRNADGEYGDARDIFALPLGVWPKWVERQREEFWRKKAAAEAGKAAEPTPLPEPEFVEPDDEPLPAGLEDEPEAACAAYIRLADDAIAMDIDIQEDRPEELPALPPEPDEPPQEVLDRVEMEELAIEAFPEKRAENEHPDDPITFSTRVPEQPLRAFLASAGIAVTDGKLGQRRLQALSAIIGSALVAAEAGQWVSYSRRRKHYSERHEYEGQAYTYDCIVPAVDELADGGWLVNAKAKGGDDLTTGLQSKFRATDALKKAFEGVEVSEVGIYNSIRLTDDNCIIVPFEHTRETTLLRREVDAINAYLATLHVELPGVERTRHHHIVDGQHVRLQRKPQVVRFFGRKRWDRHGRLYGPWQNLPKKYRLDLLLNGQECMELDFSCFHPALLYTLRGKPLDRDPYAVRGYETMRVACKIALNVGINARSLPQAINALMERSALTGDKRWVLSRSATKALLKAVIAHNEPIADAICSDAGISLMFTDSKIMIEILKASEAAGIPVLPVHDSVVVPVQHEAQMRVIMTTAYRNIMSNPLSNCKVYASYKKVPQREGDVGAGSEGSWKEYLGAALELLEGGASESSAVTSEISEVSASSGASSVTSPVLSRPSRASRPRRSYVLVAWTSRTAHRGLCRVLSSRTSSLSRRSIHAASSLLARGSVRVLEIETSEGLDIQNITNKSAA